MTLILKYITNSTLVNYNLLIKITSYDNRSFVLNIMLHFYQFKVCHLNQVHVNWIMKTYALK